MNYYKRHHLRYASSPDWSNVKVNLIAVLKWSMKTCFRIYMHSMSRVFLLARPSAHAETFCYKSVWMSAAKLPLGAFWLQLCPPGTHYVAKFYDCWFLQKNGREEKMNLITLIQQSSKAIVVFYFTLSFSPAFSSPPPLWYIWSKFWSHTLFVADQGQAGNTESLGQEPADSGKSEKR